MNENKKKLIEKHFKKKKVINILEIEFIKYCKSNIYIRLDYYKKEYLYKLSWINLDLCNDKNVLLFINTELVSLESCEHIIRHMEGKKLENKKLPKKYDDDLVNIKFNFLKSNNELTFYRYLPIEYNYLVDMLIIISKNLPSKLDEIFVRTLALITGQNYKYDYLNTVRFNLMKDNIDSLFQPEIIERGKKYLDAILYLEKIDNHYFAVVKGEENYVVVVKEEEKGKLLLHCSCPCEFYCKHIYAVLKGIKNGFEKKFYKVVFNDENKDLLNRVTNNDFILCIGYFEGRLRLINNFGEIGLLPILDENGNCPWTILEDDENNTLERYMHEVINKNND